jgi:hypothetical protein
MKALALAANCSGLWSVLLRNEMRITAPNNKSSNKLDFRERHGIFAVKHS